jgi:hypothetical protein
MGTHIASAAIAEAERDIANRRVIDTKVRFMAPPLMMVAVSRK